MKSHPTIDPRLLIAVDYRWRGGVSACYEIRSASGTTLFSVWSQTHAIIILALCKKIQQAYKEVKGEIDAAHQPINP